MPKNDNKYRSFFESSTDAMLIIENNEFVDCNPATVAMLGYESKEGIINVSPFKISPEFQPDGRLSFDKAAEMMRIAQKHGNHRFEWEHLRKDGTVIPLEVSLTAIETSDNLHLHTIWRDISSRKQAEKAKQEYEERFRHTFEANPDPVIIAKLEDSSIIDVNRAFEKVTGVSRTDALGQNSEQLGLWRNKDLRVPFREQLQDHGEVNNFEADFNVQGDQVRTGLLSARIILNNNEPCILTVIRDCTTEKAAKQALVEMDQIKSDFISTAAHELNTPLTAIMGFAELLLDPISSKSFSEEQKRDFLQEIYEKGETLNRMIKDFLDISHIESGLQIPMDLQETNLSDRLKKAFNYYKLHEPEHSFELILSKEMSHVILTIDAKRICQVLDNLLSNAVKYSPEKGKIYLQGKLTSDGCEVCVRDHGIGMSPDQTAKIFDKFYRADPLNAKVAGLGLGMCIVRQIIEEHNGRIDVESKVGKGTNVTFNLPYTAN